MHCALAGLRLQVSERSDWLYLDSDGCLLGHSLVHADEGHVVVQVIDGALHQEGGGGGGGGGQREGQPLAARDRDPLMPLAHRPLSRTRMSWMEMTEQGKAVAEVTFTITESTSSGNSYLKYCAGEVTSELLSRGLPHPSRPLSSPVGCRTVQGQRLQLKPHAGGGGHPEEELPPQV